MRIVTCSKSLRRAFESEERQRKSEGWGILRLLEESMNRVSLQNCGEAGGVQERARKDASWGALDLPESLSGMFFLGIFGYPQIQKENNNCAWSTKLSEAAQLSRECAARSRERKRPSVGRTRGSDVGKFRQRRKRQHQQKNDETRLLLDFEHEDCRSIVSFSAQRRAKGYSQQFMGKKHLKRVETRKQGNTRA